MSSQPDRDQLRQLIQTVLADGKVMGEPEKKETEAPVPWWVKIFGSAIVVIFASVLIGVIQNLYSTVHELNNELRRTNERVVGKEEFNSTKTSQWGIIRDCQEKTSKLPAAEERLRLSEERLRKVEADNAALRESVTRMEEQLKAQKGKTNE